MNLKTNVVIKMKKIKRILIILLIVSNAITSYFTYLYFTRDPAIKIVEKTKIAYKTVYRDYNKLSTNDCLKELMKYDTDIPRLDGRIEQSNIFYAEAGLNERTWSRKFKLKISEGSNWKYYVGFGVLGTIAGGTIIYKIMK
jgi:signal transduction histidine kinase